MGEREPWKRKHAKQFKIILHFASFPAFNCLKSHGGHLDMFQESDKWPKVNNIKNWPYFTELAKILQRPTLEIFFGLKYLFRNLGIFYTVFSK